MSDERSDDELDARLLLICGSLRQGSTNAAAVTTAAGLVPAGVEAVEYHGLVKLPHFNPDDDHEPLDPAVAELRAEIEAADAVLFCTPEYAGALPGSFKNLLDWTVGGSEASGTPAAWIDVAAPGRGAASHEQLRTVLRYTDFDIVEDACVKVPVLRDDIDSEGRVASPDAREHISDAVQVLLDYARARR
jgi:NAD(P)H-dependent FMN reductase